MSKGSSSTGYEAVSLKVLIKKERTFWLNRKHTCARIRSCVVFANFFNYTRTSKPRIFMVAQNKRRLFYKSRYIAVHLHIRLLVQYRNELEQHPYMYLRFAKNITFCRFCGGVLLAELNCSREFTLIWFVTRRRWMRTGSICPYNVQTTRCYPSINTTAPG